jgi:acyl carrier protein
MPDDSIRDAIKNLLITELKVRVPKEEIRDDMQLFGPEGLGLDSIDALELVVWMEKNYGAGVPNSEVAQKALASVNAIHDYILAKRRGG